MEQCPDCGFTWVTVPREEIGPRVRAGAHAIGQLLEGSHDRAGVRPSPQRWSAIEYTAHLRDVLITLRDRIVVGLVEELPSFKPMYREERVALGLYGAETPPVAVGELNVAAAMFVRLFDAIDPAQLDRTVQYGFPSPARRSLLWMGQQAVHEVEHHRDDIAEDLRVTAP